jgi:hypothetical protein
MADKRITAEQLEAALQADVKELVEKIAQAINAAKLGRIIADSEEPVRDAHAEFRERAFQKAVDLLADKLDKQDFSPSADAARVRLEEQGQAKDLAPDGQRPAGT